MFERQISSTQSDPTIDTLPFVNPAISASGRKWYAVFSCPKHEKSVNEQLRRRNVECFLPVYREIHQWKNGCKATIELPLFPNYLFVRIGTGERSRVLQVPGVLSIVGSRKEPLAIGDAEIQGLQAGMHTGTLNPHPYLKAGSNVRIKAGPMRGFRGLLIREKGEARVVMSLNLIEKSFSVEIDVCDLEADGSYGRFPSND